MKEVDTFIHLPLQLCSSHGLISHRINIHRAIAVSHKELVIHHRSMHNKVRPI